MSSENPASKLLEIAEQAKGLRDNLRVRDGWSRIFGTGNDNAQLMAEMGQAMLLPRKVLMELNERFPGQESIHQHWVNKVTQAFLVDGNGGQWKSVQQSFDAHTISALTMASNNVSTPTPGATIGATQITAMRERLEKFLDDLEASELSEGTKEVVRQHIGKVLDTLDERGITSSEAVEDAIHRTMGKAAMDPHVREDLQKSGVGKKLYEAALFVYATIGAINDSAQLPDALRNLLGGG